MFLVHLLLCCLARFHLDITALMARTPELGSSTFSPAIEFESGSCPLRRSNTLPDGHLDRARRQGMFDADGRRNSKNWGQSINGSSLRLMGGCGEELPDSPVVRGSSEATLVASPSDLDPGIMHEPRSNEANRGVPDYERMKQWTPNMQEILAKLRTFESASPTEG